MDSTSLRGEPYRSLLIASCSVNSLILLIQHKKALTHLRKKKKAELKPKQTGSFKERSSAEIVMLLSTEAYFIHNDLIGFQ